MTRTRRITLLALFAALALILFTIEAQLPPLTAVPGVKPGLSNIITVVTLYLLGPGSALTVLLIRIFLGSLLTGQVSALAYSLTGGLLAFCALLFLRRQLPVEGLWLASAFSAVFHNVGQILAAVWITRTPGLWAYLPVLILSGIAAGVFTGLVAQGVLRRLKKAAPWLFSFQK